MLRASTTQSLQGITAIAPQTTAATAAANHAAATRLECDRPGLPRTTTNVNMMKSAMAARCAATRVPRMGAPCASCETRANSSLSFRRKEGRQR